MSDDHVICETFFRTLAICILLWNLYRPETDRSFDVMAAGEVVSSSDSLSGPVTSGGTKKRKYQTEESKKMERPEITTMPAKDQWKSYLYNKIISLKKNRVTACSKSGI